MCRSLLAVGVGLLLLLPFMGFAQLPVTPNGVRQPRILLLLDGSSSMLSPWGNNLQRFTAASKVIEALMDSIYAVNNNVEFGLRVYGQNYPAQENVCTDTKREVMYSKNNLTQMMLRLAALQPRGVSPIAYSLKEAATNDLEDDERNAYSIILITDGAESCGGDICDVMKTLITRKIYFKPYILGMIDYAPLKEQYACLGTYLQVAKETDIPVAIKAITDAYRPMLSMPIMVQSKPVVAPKKDEVKIITIPAWIPETNSVNELKAVVRGTGMEVFHYNPLPRPMKVPPVKIAPMKEDEVPAAVIAAKSNPIQVKAETRTDPMPVPKPEVKPVVKPVVKTVTPPARDTAKTTVIITQLPPVKSTTKPVPKPDIDKPKETAIITSVEDAKETTTEIYFTDGHGKFYKTTPQMQLIDPKTGKLVKEFYRTVGPNGNPDPQQLPAGTYNLMVAGKANLVTHNVVIVANKKNKIMIPVSNGSLVFVYEGAPTRPIEEFDAIVNIRFEPGPTVKQRCTAELPYAPGNYYVEVNTLPVTRFNCDIDFGSETVLTLPQPGYLQVTNRNAVGKVQFYHPQGDRYVPFYSLNITGNPEDQKLRLKPGKYEVHWVKNPALPYATESVQSFMVNANSLSSIELH